ncbi:MAG: peroxide stress protein YaaA [Woeseiaceae bacterium]
MIILLSPAKTLDYETPAPLAKTSEPEFVEDSATLIRGLKKQSVSDIRSLMKLSPTLAELNVARYQAWKKTPDHAATKQAIFAFKGDVYQGFEADSLSARDINWAQKRIRILSGLYGVLKPLDRMQPYRLEMGTRLKTQAGASLYDFWGDRLTRRLASELDGVTPKACINLASNEYFKAVDPSGLGAKLVTPKFLDFSRGEYRFLSFFAKRARGLMARWLVTERVTTLKSLVDFDVQGYRYSESHSQDGQPTFIRDKQ